MRSPLGLGTSDTVRALSRWACGSAGAGSNSQPSRSMSVVTVVPPLGSTTPPIAAPRGHARRGSSTAVIRPVDASMPTSTTRPSARPALRSQETDRRPESGGSTFASVIDIRRSERAIRNGLLRRAEGFEGDAGHGQHFFGEDVDLLVQLAAGEPGQVEKEDEMLDFEAIDV